MNALAALLLVAVATAAAHAQQPIVVGPNVQVSKANADLEHSEVVVSADPNDAKHLLASAMVGNRKSGGFDLITYVSFNGGAQWTPTLTVHTDLGFNGDPATAFGCDGSAFALNLSIMGTGYERNHIEVHRSKDGGRTWLPPTLLRWSDREYMTVDCTNSKYRGRAYIIAQGEMTAADGRRVIGTRLFISRDSGKTFTEWNFPPAANRSSVFQGPPVVLSDGTFLGIIVDYPADRPRGGTGGGILRVFHSEDGGNTFSGARTVAELSVIPAGFPQLAVDQSTGPFGDRVYAVWQARRSAESPRAFVWIAHSSDKGRTWSTPVVVNDDGADGNGPKSVGAFMAEVAVNRDGVVGVTWYDRFDPTHERDFTARFAASFDGGASFTRSVQVSEHPFLHDSAKAPPILLPSFGGGSILRTGAGPVIQIGVQPNRFFENGGDTGGLAADADGIFHPLWVDNRTGIAQMWTASVRVNGRVALAAGEAESAASVLSAKGSVDAARGDTAAPRAADDITASVMMHIGEAALDPATKRISAVAYLINTSGKALVGPLVAKVLSIDLPGTEIINADNHEVGVGATWDFTTLLNGNRLEPGARSKGKRIEFRVPDAAAQARFPRITAMITGKVGGSRPAGRTPAKSPK
jgi:hypothetical protein